ncbi:hypothetical protein AhnVgp105 [Adoxophyes honmai nucleopolyhedrovirus]|uniref:Uncharacterized protein n=1 Tax=Adoxophyes honmai nucleopolyhedrovirus TaxID=224399 RepID=Q80LJ1_NPVAH|nr:hypothetical protein AhnVgp105 [Adoxophyes honmai nucleopolyhedrovirus]BAC67356.1 hypothetical protein [Adoxophyes honmai nucleopolyhedrovirus]
MEIYDQLIKSAMQESLPKRIINRETGFGMSKTNTALSVQFLALYDSKRKILDNNHRRCPYQFEAEGIDFSRAVCKQKEKIKRCIYCNRVLHIFMNQKNTVSCNLCNVK